MVEHPGEKEPRERAYSIFRVGLVEDIPLLLVVQAHMQMEA